MIKDIHRDAVGRWESILLGIGVASKFLSSKHGPCPFCGGKDRFRWDNLEGGGGYFCTHCKAGNGIDFVIKFLGVDFKEAVRLVRLHIPSSVVAAHKKVKDDETVLKEIKRVWREARNASQTDEAGRYLHARGLEIPRGQNSLKTHPALFWRDSEGVVKGTYPCMLAAIKDGQGRTTAIHRTWVKDGAKAPVVQPRKSWGKITIHSAIQLFPAKDILAVAEGIETALAVNKLLEVPCWSLISASQLERFCWPNNIKTLIIAGDNDASFTGQKASYTLAYRARQSGLKVEVMMPEKKGTDWADVVMFGDFVKNEERR